MNLVDNSRLRSISQLRVRRFRGPDVTAPHCRATVRTLTFAARHKTLAPAYELSALPEDAQSKDKMPRLAPRWLPANLLGMTIGITARMAASVRRTLGGAQAARWPPIIAPTPEPMAIGSTRKTSKDCER